jgi:hypothetical protein
MKKRPMSIAIVLLSATFLSSAMFAARASAETIVIKGSLQAVETSVVDFPTLFVDGSGWGNVTNLGQCIVRYEVEVNIPDSGGPASIQFIVANGDSFFGSGPGLATDTETDNVVTIVEEYEINDGTGRFAGATGSITVKRVLHQLTGVTSGTIDGKIVTP